MEIDAQKELAEGLEGMARIAAVRGLPWQAAQLGGAAEALRETLDAPLAPSLRAGHARAARDLREALGETAFAAAWAKGRALPLEEAIILALEGQDEAL
jgi:hypothetical protein